MAGTSVGCRFAAFADRDLSRPGLLEVAPMPRVHKGFAEVVEVGDRDLRQALVFAPPKEPPRALAELLDRRSRGRVMALIHRREQPDVGRGVLRDKARHGPLAASDGAGRAVLSDEPRDLLPGIAADLHQGTDHDPLVGPGEGEIPESDQGLLHPLITGGGAAQDRKGHRLGAGQKLGQLVNGGQVIEVHKGLHLPIMNKTRSSFRLISC